ncbi:AbrB/MazE/SpoVT family DNA-binding domain-containing protein [Nodosilinea sp. P-1105]|uniref:AbrB/MazE/SpoVT family DNA-binding domain-containing protein n=1 Tax=Nodosilinea sp. P-1105 TaxID=2546229 RepID=UPI00146A5911|nr:AbrB/MazE/SpoVT family DNA-binding domain-containing protein [Nodosilinea sp. P-1105]NMF82980.1 AbrB/MazE/SpoVT family DNA-binding domain-containing protein [Nodosilinea sp. P-1105]
MDIQLKKWGNSLGLRIPHRLAESFGWDENSTVEMLEVDGALVIRKKAIAASLDELLTSIPDNFCYPTDVNDFVNSGPQGQEWL